jgi:thioredoxin 1
VNLKGGMNMSLVYANADNFKDNIAEGTVIVDFYADWCAPCRMIGPVLEQISEEQADLKIVKVNVDENPQLASEFGVRGIPALFVVKDGKTVAQKAGFMPKDALVDWAKNA